MAEDTTLEELAALDLAMRSQLGQLRQHLQANPGDTETAELCAELEEALASTQAAHDSTEAAQEAAATAAEQQHDGHADPPPSPAQQQPTSGSSAGTKRKAPDAEGPDASQQQRLSSSSSKQQRRQQAAAAMHPSNLYAAGEPDFAALAAAHPPLARHLIYPTSSNSSSSARPAIDFTSWEATKDLTAALLRCDFGVAWDLPAGQLVPPVPNRANYIHWVADLLQLSSPPLPPATPAAAAAGAGTAPQPVCGLDIGCGANLIYCLLGAATYGWRMVGADVTDVALTAAQQLVDNNPGLAGLLEVRRSRCVAGADFTRQQQQQGDQPLGPLMGVLGGTQECFHFCMCNPPFFESLAEANQNPNTACGGTAEEMVAPGGELAFVRAMIADSRALRGRVHWYTSMCGKKGSMKVLRQELHSAGVTALRTTELVQGKTSRWAIAWSFTVPASTANMPLPRAHRPTQQQQQQPAAVIMGRPIQPQPQQQSKQQQERPPSRVSQFKQRRQRH